VLIFAWALGQAIEDTRAADFLVNSVGSSINPGLIPFITVVIASILSFATGTAWGVMVIMFPLCIPLTQSIAPNNESIMTQTIASLSYSMYLLTSLDILAGSVFGNHCSPISDTTILASMSANCHLIEHVKTQIPYALLVGLVAIIVGSLPTGLGW
jgi:Na+/H+ antiporter NhaC